MMFGPHYVTRKPCVVWVIPADSVQRYKMRYHRLVDHPNREVRSMQWSYLDVEGIHRSRFDKGFNLPEEITRQLWLHWQDADPTVVLIDGVETSVHLFNNHDDEEDSSEEEEDWDPDVP